jgi:hypothetical protein
MRLRGGRSVVRAGVAFEVAGVLGVGAVTPLVRPGSLVVPDGAFDTAAITHLAEYQRQPGTQARD